MKDRYDYNLNYKFFQSEAEIGLMNVFQFYAGRLNPQSMTYYNTGTFYIQEDALGPIYPSIKRALPEFAWWGDFSFRPYLVRDLWWEMFVLGRQIMAAKTVAQLSAALKPGWRGVDKDNFVVRRGELFAMTEDIRMVAQIALQRNVPLWIISP
jgi:hypothetical protein